MIVQGTDNVLQWWFYVATPLAWVLLIIRVLQNLLEDIKLFIKGKPLPIQNAMTNISE
jgi:TRAP-type C4-dicarboxylate transport system permease small subunit